MQPRIFAKSATLLMEHDTRNQTRSFARQTKNSSYIALCITMSTLSKTSKSQKKVVSHVLHGYCDLCWFGDAHGGMLLCRCRDCGINFHRECYGIAAQPKRDPNLQCFACQAIGKTVRTRARDPDTGERIALTVTERPTECCLCGVDNGHEFLHAMHPVFDDHGPCGRQIILKPTAGKPLRLAWAHTLCCLTISKQSGCVYGCLQDGSFAAEEGGAFNYDEEEEDDNESTNSMLVTPKERAVSADVTHFAYLHQKNEIRDAKYFECFKHMEEAKQLKCFLCGKNDKSDVIYRIPLKCCANDQKEFAEFRGSHPDLLSEPCYQACHVGCAAWYRQADGSWPLHRHVFFFPSDKTQKRVANIFCTTHALDVERQVHAKRGLRYQYIAPTKATSTEEAQQKRLRKHSDEPTNEKSTSADETKQKTVKRHQKKLKKHPAEPTHEKHTSAAEVQQKTMKKQEKNLPAPLEKATTSTEEEQEKTVKKHPVEPTKEKCTEVVQKTMKSHCIPAKSIVQEERNLAAPLPTSNLLEIDMKTCPKATISESKRQRYNESALEQKFIEIVEDIRKRWNNSNDSLENILKTEKIALKEKLNLSQHIFYSLWSKVVTTLQKDN